MTKPKLIEHLQTLLHGADIARAFYSEGARHDVAVYDVLKALVDGVESGAFSDYPPEESELSDQLFKEWDSELHAELTKLGAPLSRIQPEGPACDGSFARLRDFVTRLRGGAPMRSM